MKNTNKKGFTLVEIMIVVVIIGLLAAMAIPAFNKVREQSRQKTMTNNLRQIASSGQQYILEEGTTSATYGNIVPDYLAEVAPAADEEYDTIVIIEAGGVITAVTSGGLGATYTY